MTIKEISCLLIRSPYIERILSGDKTWEIRGKPTKKRGLIGLVRSGSKTIVGVCELTNVIGPLTLPQFESAYSFHRDDIGDLINPQLPYPETYAWVLGNVRTLRKPVPYVHPSGAITWVTAHNVEIHPDERILESQ